MAMKGGRKNMKKAYDEDNLSLQEGQGIMQVVSLRGSNLIEVMDAKGIKSLALFPARFQKSFWIKRGSFVVVDESGREKALESGSKVTCMVSQVLSHDLARTLEKSSEWPIIFKTTSAELSSHRQKPTSETDEDSNSDDDDLPPLEANRNRNGPADLCSDTDTNAASDSDPGF